MEFTDLMEVTAVVIRGNNAYGGSKYTRTFYFFYDTLNYPGVGSVQDITGAFRESFLLHQ